MADKTLEDAQVIREIIDEHPRLKYLLTFTFKQDLASVTGLRVDGDNNKIDVHFGDRMFRFKDKGEGNVLMSSAKDPSIMTMEFDPALSQAVLLIVGENAGE